MPSTTRSAFRSAPDKTQNISAKKPEPTPAPQETEDAPVVAEVEVVTISKAEYESLLEAKKTLDDLQNVLNK